MDRHHRTTIFVKRMTHGAIVGVGGLSFALTFFLVLPLMQTLGKPPDADLVVQSIDTAELPPPPPPPEQEEEKQPEPEEQPPELMDELPPLDLSQLELALNTGFTGDWPSGDFAVKLNTVSSAVNDVDSIFSLADLDQMPRAVFQPSPVLNPSMRKKLPGSVNLIFIVNENGRVENPAVQSSSDPAFAAAALAAVKQWKFEPGKRNGQSVRFRMRVPLTFPKGS